MNISVPPDIAERLKAKVAAGNYASESELIAAALDALDDRERSLEDWLHNEVIPAYDACMANPESGIPAEQVFGEAEARYLARKSPKRERE